MTKHITVRGSDIRREHIECNPRESRYNASWTYDAGRAFKGCPLGRGSSQVLADFDLIRRTNYENGVDITVDCTR